MEWVYLIAALALSVVFIPKPKTPQQSKPTEADIDMPTTEQGRKVPVIFGTPWVEDPICAWWGDLYVKAVKSKGGKK